MNEIVRQSREEHILIPVNLDIEKILEENKVFEFPNFNRFKALYVINSILKARSSQRREMLDNNTNYANVSSKILQSVVSDYTRYVAFLKASGVISSDNHYVIGEKSKAYCINAPYSGQKLKTIKVEDSKLVTAIKHCKLQLAKQQKKSTLGYGYLTKWWESGKLEINVDAAEKWIEEYSLQKIQTIEADITAEDKQKFIDQVIDTCEDFKQLVYDLKDKRHVHFSGLGHRLYNPICNLKKELREFLTYDRQPLVEIDIKNSQPFFCLALFNKTFWQRYEKNIFEKLNLEKISKELYKKIRIKDIDSDIIMSENNPESQCGKGLRFKKFIKNVVDGTFYDYIEDHFKPIYPNRFCDRNAIKKEVLRIMYMNPKMDSLPFYNTCKTFKRHFPEVYSLFRIIKSDDYRLLPLILQRIESHVVIDKVCKKISLEYPEVYISTIHDSIITTKGNEHVVEQILKSEIKKIIGNEPTVGIKYLLRES